MNLILIYDTKAKHHSHDTYIYLYHHPPCKFWESDKMQFLPLAFHLYHFHSISTTSIPSLPLPFHLYHFHSISTTSINHHPHHLGGKLTSVVCSLFFKFLLFTCIFAFNHVIPFDIVSFYSFSQLITFHPEDRKSLCKCTLFIGGRRVEGDSNVLSSLQNE